MSLDGLCYVSVDRCRKATTNFTKHHNSAAAKWREVHKKLNNQVVYIFFGLIRTNRYKQIVGDSWDAMPLIQKEYPELISKREISIINDYNSKESNNSIKNLIQATDATDILVNSVLANFISTWS